jgi:hypothetical protein
MNLQWIVTVFLVFNTCITRSALVLSASTTPSPPVVASYRPRPPQRAESQGEQEGISSVLQSIRSSLLRLEASLFEPPCNATGALAVDCDAPPAPAHRGDWLGRHHYGLRRQILSYTPTSTQGPAQGWKGATPGPDGAFDAEPDPPQGTTPGPGGAYDAESDPPLGGTPGPDGAYDAESDPPQGGTPGQEGAYDADPDAESDPPQGGTQGPEGSYDAGPPPVGPAAGLGGGPVPDRPSLSP